MVFDKMKNVVRNWTGSKPVDKKTEGIEMSAKSKGENSVVYTNEKETTEAESKSGVKEPDQDAPENFQPVSEGPGSLLKAKRNIEHVMNINDAGFIDLEKDDAVLTLYDFENSYTKERALIFLIGEVRYIYMTKEFDEDFHIVHKGTYKHKKSDVENLKDTKEKINE